MFSQLKCHSNCEPLVPMVIPAATILPTSQFRHLYISIEGVGDFFLVPIFIPKAVILPCVIFDISYISTKGIGDIFQIDLDNVFVDLAFKGIIKFFATHYKSLKMKSYVLCLVLNNSKLK